MDESRLILPLLGKASTAFHCGYLFIVLGLGCSGARPGSGPNVASHPSRPLFFWPFEMGSKRTEEIKKKKKKDE